MVSSRSLADHKSSDYITPSHSHSLMLCELLAMQSNEMIQLFRSQMLQNVMFSGNIR